MKQKLGTIRFALTFAGCFLGAGYVSGQELWQYFGSFGPVAVPALAISIALIGIMTVLITGIVARLGRSGVDDIVIRWNIPWLKELVLFVVEFMFFGITSVMIAGIGALGMQLLGLPLWAGALIAITLASVLAYYGFDGVVSVFSGSVPVLVIAALVIAVIRLKNAGVSAIRFPGGDINPMLGVWWLSLLDYMALNLSGSIGILAPVSENVRKPGSAIGGIIIGMIALFCLGTGLLCAIATAPDSVTKELPMLSIAADIGPLFQGIYGVLLFLGMFGNALATLVAVLEYMRSKVSLFRKDKLSAIMILGIGQFALSLAGFSGLIGVVYPIYGYIGLAMSLLIIEHYIHLRISGKKGRML